MMAKKDWALPTWLVLAYVPVAAFAMTHHKMWRDELHCWLVARDAATRNPTDEQTLAYSSALAASRHQDAILIMNRPLIPKLVDGVRVWRVAELYDSMIEEQNFYLYRVSP